MSSRAATFIVLFASTQLALMASAQTVGYAEPAPTELRSRAQGRASTDEAKPPAPVEPHSAEPTAKTLKGFELLAAAGYGHAMNRAYGLKLQPYGATFGLGAGYTWSFGLRLGTYLDYGLGRATEHARTSRLDVATEQTDDAWSLNTGLSIGHDLWLRFLILRYSWSLGVTWMNWDINSVPDSMLRGFPNAKGSTVGLHMAPGLALLWPFRRLTCGVSFDYFIQVKDEIPLGVVGKLIVGVKL